MINLENIRPPAEAFNYWPEGRNISTGSKDEIRRLIFSKVPYSAFEQEQLSTLRSKISVEEVCHGLLDEDLMRVLNSCYFNLEKSVEALAQNIKFKSQEKPFPETLLDSGAIYFHGRDCYYRPLLIINIGKFDLDNYVIEDYLNFLCYLLDLVISHMLIPGQVENWNVILDLDGINFKRFPKLKKCIRVLQDNYYCRLAMLYIVNTPSNFTVLWNYACNIMEGPTLNKIKIYENSIIEDMQFVFAEGQYERKYGGAAKNLACFWPPAMPEGPFTAEQGYSESGFSTQDPYYQKENKFALKIPVESKRDSFVSMNLFSSKSPSLRESPFKKKRKHDVIFETFESEPSLFCGNCNCEGKAVTCSLL